MSNDLKRFGSVATASAVALLSLALFAPGQANAQAGSKIVTIVIPEEPDTLDICNSTRSSVGRVVKMNVAETLTELDPDANDLKPRLALSWERVNDLTWRFKLRPGVTFHDGTPFNATNAGKAIARTMDSKLDCETRTKSLSDLKFESKAVDDLTLELTTNKPEPILPIRIAILTMASPNSSWDKLVLDPVGTGPYIMEKYVPGDSVTLKRNEKYWGKKPVVEGAKYIWRKESSVMAAMVKVGEADLAPTIAPQDATDKELDYSYANSETTYLRLESQLPPLDDKRVRLALQYAIDRNALKGSIFPKEVLLATQMVFPSIIGHNHELDKKARPYDPAMAKKLLAEAKAAGVPVDRKIQMIGRINQWPNTTETMEAVLAMYQAIGMNVSLRMVEAQEWVTFNINPYKGASAKEGQNKSADRDPVILGHMHDNNNGDPVFSMFNKYTCGAAASPHCNPELDKLIAQATTTSGPERTKLWQEVMKVTYEDMAADAWLFHMVGYSRVGKRINFKPSTATNTEILLENITFK